MRNLRNMEEFQNLGTSANFITMTHARAHIESTQDKLNKVCNFLSYC